MAVIILMQREAVNAFDTRPCRPPEGLGGL